VDQNICPILKKNLKLEAMPTVAGASVVLVLVV
jgi:hypothetical protein